MSRYRITATQKYTVPLRVEDLGVHEANTGQKAKRYAIARGGAARCGFPYIKRGRGHYDTEGWTFKIELVRGD